MSKLEVVFQEKKNYFNFSAYLFLWTKLTTFTWPVANLATNKRNRDVRNCDFYFLYFS